jgi:hypothetical protein
MVVARSLSKPTVPVVSAVRRKVDGLIASVCILSRWVAVKTMLLATAARSGAASPA